MAEELTQNNKSAEKNYGITLNSEGWYYDAQLNNELQSISLHANQKFQSSGETNTLINKDGVQIFNQNYDDWVPWSGEGDEAYDDDLYDTNYAGDKDKACGYRIKPLCRSLFYEDFVINTANTWSDLGSDLIGGLWDSVRSTAPFSDFLSGAIGTMADKFRGQGYDSKAANLIQGLLDTSSKLYGGLSDYQNRSLIVTGTQLSLFGGTGIDFSNLGLRLTLFPKVEDYDSSVGGYVYKTVIDQVEELYPYLIGIYKKDTTLSDIANRTFNKVEEKTGKKPLPVYDMSSYIGWNNPPGGYKANNHALDAIHQGTLKLRIGGQYSIPNLVCQSATFSFSKQMVKLPVKYNSGEITTSPLFCDLVVILRPMSKLTNRILKEYISAKAKDSNDAYVGRKVELNKKINDQLNNLKDKQ